MKRYEARAKKFKVPSDKYIENQIKAQAARGISQKLAVLSTIRRTKKLKKMAESHKLSGEATKLMKSHGLTVKKNPSIAELGQSLQTLAPSMAVGAVSLVGGFYAGKQVSDLAAKGLAAVKVSVPDSISPYMPAISSAAIGVVGYALARMTPAVSKFSMPILMGGLGASAVNLLAAIRVDDPAVPGQKVSLGARLGLPIGDYVGVGEYAAISGMGEYAAISGDAAMAQLDEARQGSRGTQGEPTVDEFQREADEEDAGVLSGGIFD